MIKTILCILGLAFVASAQCICFYPQCAVNEPGVKYVDNTCYTGQYCDSAYNAITNPYLAVWELGSTEPKVGTNPKWRLRFHGPQLASVPSSGFLVSLDSALQTPPVQVSGYPDPCDYHTPFLGYENLTLSGGQTWGGAIILIPWSFSLPNNPGLIGLKIYSQGLLVTPGGRLIMSQAIELTIQA